MAEFTLTGADQNLLDAVSMTMDSSPDPCDGFPGEGLGVSEGGVDIPFQFPPYITSDAKSVNWKILSNKLVEPIVLWDGASSRKITLTATYIVTGGEWSAAIISELTHRIKAYFYRSIDKASSTIPIIRLRMYGHSHTTSTWRAESVNITHSGALINDSQSGGDSRLVFPMRTDVTWDLALTTRIAEDKESDGAQPGGNKLPDEPLKEWY